MVEVVDAYNGILGNIEFSTCVNRKEEEEKRSDEMALASTLRVS
jgi:hypothetical protein